MKNSKVQHLVIGAMIAALYIVINYAQEMIFPASTTMAIQFRLAEALCVFACITPSAIWGLTLGTFVANFVSMGTLPLDWALGSLATLIAAVCMYQLKNLKLFTLPLLSALMPALVNGVIIGLEIEIFYVEGGFHFGSFLINAGCVALGELAVLMVLGMPLYKLIERIPIFHYAKQ